MSSTPSVVPDLQASSTYIDAPSSDRWHTWEKVALQCVCVWGGGGPPYLGLILPINGRCVL